MKIQFLSVLIVSALFLTSCYNNFHLKENIEIQELSFHISYDSSLNQSDVEILELNTQQFLEEYRQLNASDIKLDLASDREEADLTLHIDKIAVPAKSVKMLGIAISAGTMVWIATNPKVGLYFWPFAYFNTTTSTTRVKYSLNSKFATSFPKKGERAMFSSARKWQKVEIEKQLHLKHFDALLAEFFSHLNREYRKVQAK